jgi:PAS domain S-box-containing protein
MARHASGRALTFPGRLELELFTVNGQTKPVSVHIVDSVRGAGLSGAYRALLFDDSARRGQLASERMVAQACESACGICVMDAPGVVLQVNEAFTALTGYAAAEMRGQALSVLDAGKAGQDGLDGLMAGLAGSGVWRGEACLMRKDHSTLIAWLDLSILLSEDGSSKRVVAQMYDITAHANTRQEIERLAFYDPLTQLPNRRLLMERLERTLEDCGANGQHGALLFIDIDNFKIINDTRGHAAGDQLLVEVSRRLRIHSHAGDTVARLGGDEFVVLLTGLSSLLTIASA